MVQSSPWRVERNGLERNWDSYQPMAERPRMLQGCSAVSPSVPASVPRPVTVLSQKGWARPAQHWNRNHSKARCLTLWDADQLILVRVRNLRIRSLFSLKRYLVLCFLFLWSFLRRWKHVFKKLFGFWFFFFFNFQKFQIVTAEWGVGLGCIARPINRVIIRWPWAAPWGRGAVHWKPGQVGRLVCIAASFHSEGSLYPSFCARFTVH